MTPEAALAELLQRLAAQRGAPVLLSEQELGTWPGATVAAMKVQGVLTQARPASSVVCPGCEEACAMPVQVVSYPTGPRAFIVCDRRDDVNRVPVPIDRLKQWQASARSIADLLTRLLNLRPLDVSGPDAVRWEIGILKGTKHSSHVVLSVDGSLTLSLAGHSIPLMDVLTLEGDRFVVDRRALQRRVDQPIQGGGDVESAGSGASGSHGRCRRRRMRASNRT
jgi:hypothetical protein